MLELLLLITFGGLMLASHRRMGLANPFQIYFLIWFLVFFGYYSSGNSFIKVQSEFLMLLLAAKSFAFLILITAFKTSSIKTKRNNISLGEIKNNKFILMAQVLVCLATPLAYKKALSLSGADIFSVLGYIQLRSAMTEDGQGFGILAYLSTLSYIVTSTSAILYATKSIGFMRLIFSIVVSLFYVYLGTGRTSVLLLLILIFIPLVILNLIHLKGIFIFSLLVVVLFVFIAGMTAKGISVEVGFIENLNSFIENIRGYTVAPFLALSQLANINFSIALGANTFRTFIALAYGLGLSDLQPIALIRGWAYVPDPTNVYTVYETYFRDFLYIGIIVPPLFLAAHWWLYRKAIKIGGIWVFYYSASVYPLAMQFFQDQYFSLFSTWVQIGFWYWLFVSARKNSFFKIRNYHA